MPCTIMVMDYRHHSARTPLFDCIIHTCIRMHRLRMQHRKAVFSYVLDEDGLEQVTPYFNDAEYVSHFSFPSHRELVLATSLNCLDLRTSAAAIARARGATSMREYLLSLAPFPFP